MESKQEFVERLTAVEKSADRKTFWSVVGSVVGGVSGIVVGMIAAPAEPIPVFLMAVPVLAIAVAEVVGKMGRLSVAKIIDDAQESADQEVAELVKRILKEKENDNERDAALDREINDRQCGAQENAGKYLGNKVLDRIRDQVIETYSGPRPHYMSLAQIAEKFLREDAKKEEEKKEEARAIGTAETKKEQPKTLAPMPEPTEPSLQSRSQPVAAHSSGRGGYN